jgi:ubiquinone/menaquinone biosynthesis C-methylase UbiE
MLRLLREKLRKKGVRNVKIIRGEYSGLNLPGESVDVVFSSWSFPAHSPNMERNLARFKKVLRPGGMILIAEMVPRGEFWEMRKEVLGEQYRQSVVPAVNEWLTKQGFRKKEFNAVMNFRTKKGVVTLCRGFFGGEISGYLIGKGRTTFRMGMGLFCWEKK